MGLQKSIIYEPSMKSQDDFLAYVMATAEIIMETSKISRKCVRTILAGTFSATKLVVTTLSLCYRSCNKELVDAHIIYSLI